MAKNKRDLWTGLYNGFWTGSYGGRYKDFYLDAIELGKEDTYAGTKEHKSIIDGLDKDLEWEAQNDGYTDGVTFAETFPKG